MASKNWTSKQLVKLKKEYPTKPTKQLANELGKSYAAVKSRAGYLKLKKIVFSHSPYSVEKLKYLIENYPNKLNSILAKELNVSTSSIGLKAYHLGLKKSKDFFKNHSGKGFFKKGHIPANKGKKQIEFMSASAIEKTKATQFKKGDKPHNTKYNGHERISKEGYVEIRVAERDYRLKHRLNWEKENGCVPKGHVLTCLDGNKRNTSSENWELITMEENMLRNSIHKFPQEIVPSMALSSKLRNKIKTIENGKQ